MTAQTEKRWPGWRLPVLLLTLVVGGWLGGVAYFMNTGNSRAGALAAEGPGDPDDIPDAVLGSLGGLMGANLHQSYLNIGLLADAVEGQLYTPDDGRNLLAAVSALIDTTETQMKKLPGANLPPDDQKQLDRFRAVIPPLKTQVKELELYWATDSKEHADRFQQARIEAQTALEALVGK